MRIVLTIPDDVVTVEVYAKSKNEAITYSRIFEGGSITNSRFIDKEETMGMRYTEGLEKRIDELEETFNKRIQKAHDRLNQFNERFANLNSHIDAVEGTFIERTDRLEKRIAAHAKSIASTDADIGEWCDDTDKLEKRMEKLENRLAKLEKPCIDAETFDKALDIPKLKPIPEPLENRGPYADILRRLGALEKRANVARADITKIMGHKVTLEERVDKLEERAKVSRPTWEYFNKLLERIEELERRVEPIESLLDKGEDGAYPFIPTFKDYAEIMRQIDALKNDAKTSRPTWDNFSLHDQRICKLESRMEDAEKNAEVARGVRNITANEVKDLKIRLEDAEKKAVVAESVRKQLAADIKATNGRIQDLEERTGQSRDRLYAY